LLFNPTDESESQHSTSEEPEEIRPENYDDRVEEVLDHLYGDFIARKNKHKRNKQLPTTTKSRFNPSTDVEEMGDFDSDLDLEAAPEQVPITNPLLYQQDDSKNAAMFFSQDLFLGMDSDEELDGDREQTRIQPHLQYEGDDDDEEAVLQEIKEAKKRKAMEDLEQAAKRVKQESKKKKKGVDVGGFEVVPQDDWVLDSDLDEEEHAQILALGKVMKTKAAARLQDDSYNRYTWNDSDELPVWFQADEGAHNKPTLPLTKAQVAEMKLRWREINARDIKKVAESKARKKRKLSLRMEKAKKQAEAVLANSELNAKAKTEEIRRLYRKAEKVLVKKDKKYMVSRASRTRTNGGKAAIPKKMKKGGTRVQLVDPRQKKEKRAAKAAKKRRK
jgi:AdoMet-dependent rRNA methyltransferase SPB1